MTIRQFCSIIITDMCARCEDGDSVYEAEDGTWYHPEEFRGFTYRGPTECSAWIVYRRIKEFESAGINLDQ